MQINEVEAYLKIEKEFDNLKYLLSEQSLHLLPEYQQRVDVSVICVFESYLFKSYTSLCMCKKVLLPMYLVMTIFSPLIGVLRGIVTSHITKT